MIIKLDNNILFFSIYNDHKKIKKIKIKLLKFLEKKKKIKSKALDLKIKGYVLSVGDGIVKASGLRTIGSGALVRFETKELGIVLNLEKKYVKIVVLGNGNKILPGQIITHQSQLMGVNISYNFLGRVIDGLGIYVDNYNKKAKKNFFSFYKNVDVKAPGIIRRQRVTEPVYTGIIIIDSMIPIGRGQRELIIGDRKTGKTTIAIDTILTQSVIPNIDGYNTFSGLFCVYVSIGQRKSSIANIVKKLKNSNSLFYSIIVCATASDAASLQFLTPYTGCAIGEFFRDSGKHAIIIYDDLSKQAVAYRQVSLLLRRPPSREAYPGDIFYLHSRLLERAAKLNNLSGNGSLTALPIIETQAGDISAYIPTNVISITDGQIFLETSLFYKGVRPAVNVGISVSRIGSAAQEKCLKKIAGSLKLEFSQYKEIEVFATLGSDIDEFTRKVLSRGQRLVEVLKQKQADPLTIYEQIVLIIAVTYGFFDSIVLDQVQDFKNQIILSMEYKKDLNNYKVSEELPLEYIKEFLTTELLSFLKNN
jgi:proton translocating ATP synthase, F1 alpha subunit